MRDDTDTVPDGRLFWFCFSDRRVLLLRQGRSYTEQWRDVGKPFNREGLMANLREDATLTVIPEDESARLLAIVAMAPELLDKELRGE